MHRRFGVKAMTVSLLLVGASATVAQQPGSLPPGFENRTVVLPAATPQDSVPIGVIETEAPDGSSISRVQHSTDCNFDPYESYRESIWRHRASKNALRPIGRHDCSRTPDGGYRYGERVDTECANCWSLIDVEKRFILGYGKSNAHKPATVAGYGDGHAIQFTTEILPWVIYDGDMHYTRWGIATMFSYTHYEGNRGVNLITQGGGALRVENVESYGLTIGPTWRDDFLLAGIRLSPSVTTGLAFDWTDVADTTPNTANPTRTIDFFKFSGFDAGGYVRLMLDFGITQKINIGVGMDYRFIVTDVMIRDSDVRKHLGFVLSISHVF